MKRAFPIFPVAILSLLGFAFSPLRASAQSKNGSVEFVARATPSGGLEEPVRGFPFFLLSKSFEEINREVDASLPKPDMDAFIDKLDVSKELKAWMKKNHWLQLSGGDFVEKVKPADVIEVPEFFTAYLHRNSGYAATNFPKSKVKSSDTAKDPAKAAKGLADYKEAVRRYIDQNPDTIDGIDLELAQSDPSSKWNALQAKRGPELHRTALDLAQSKYFVARTETDLHGEGVLSGIQPGSYWLSTLDISADVGDARLRWDTQLNVRPGEEARVALTNVNASQVHDTP
jgi:hypothetical protein